MHISSQPIADRTAGAAARVVGRPRTTPTRRGSRGQSVVEFALILVPLMLLLLGAVQFGVIWATQIGVTNAVRDSVRAASLVQPKVAGDSSGTVTAAREIGFAASIKNDVLKPALAANVPFYDQGNVDPATEVCYTSFLDVSTQTSLRATVTVIYDHPVFIPLLSGILGGGITTRTQLSIPVGMEQPFVLPTAGDSGCSQWP